MHTPPFGRRQQLDSLQKIPHHRLELHCIDSSECDSTQTSTLRNKILIIAQNLPCKPARTNNRKSAILRRRVNYLPCSIPHLFKHSKLPLTAPVPTSGIPLPSCAVSRFASPNAARFMSSGMAQSPLRALSVPLSSLFNALRRSAGSQPTAI